MFLSIDIERVKEMLNALGFKRTTSRRFRRYERGNKGVELLEYYNLTELELYARVDNTYKESDLDDLRSELKEVFKDFMVA